MPDAVHALVLDLVEWIAKAPRPYADVMEAWRTSCPRLMVWEEACDRSLVQRIARPGEGVLVIATPEGLAALRAAGRPVPAPATRVA